MSDSPAEQPSEPWSEPLSAAEVALVKTAVAVARQERARIDRELEERLGAITVSHGYAPGDPTKQFDIQPDGAGYTLRVTPQPG